VKNGIFSAIWGDSQGWTELNLSLNGQLGQDEIKGDFVLDAKADNAFQKCDHRSNFSWTARKVSLEEARPYLSIYERIGMGDSIQLIKSVELAEVGANVTDCKSLSLMPLSKPSVFKKGTKQIGYTVQIDLEAAILIQQLSISIEGPVGGGGTNTACTDYAMMMGRLVPSIITGFMSRSENAPYPPGTYKFLITINNSPGPSYTETFQIK
jgi:hypothetical protein